jgi:hypothetical protein
MCFKHFVHSIALPCHSLLLCCAVLCCAVLCCAVLCCAVLCCAVLCCAVLCCAAGSCSACQRLMRRLSTRARYASQQISSSRNESGSS